eukprot:IDg4684t1
MHPVIHLLITDRHEQYFLAVKEDSTQSKQLTLPNLQHEKAGPYDIQALVEGARTKLGIEFKFTVLTCVYNDEKRDEMCSVLLAACDTIPSKAPCAMQWVRAAGFDPASVVLENRDAETAVHSELSRLVRVSEPSPLRAPWAFFSWHEETLQWVHAKLIENQIRA